VAISRDMVVQKDAVGERQKFRSGRLHTWIEDVPDEARKLTKLEKRMMGACEAACTNTGLALISAILV
jgi:hypothetical protein